MSKHSFVSVTEISTPVDRRESGLRFNENNLIQVLELSSDIVCVCKAGAIKSVNSHGVSLLGAKNEAELIGRPFLTLWPMSIRRLLMILWLSWPKKQSLSRPSWSP